MTTTDTIPAANASRQIGTAIARILSKYGTLIALAVLIVAFGSIAGDLFLTSGNMIDIASDVAIGTIIACGLTVPLIASEFDLSIGYVASFAGVLVTGFLVNQNMPLMFAVLVTVGICALVGIVNGLLVTKAGVNSFVATLGTGTFVIGLNFATNSGVAVSAGLPDTFLKFGFDRFLGVPLTVWVAVAVCAVLWVLVNRTLFGYYAQAVGQNPEAAHLAGVRVDRVRILAMTVCSVCAGVGGILLAAKLGSGQSNSADGYLLSAFAAAFLGSVALRDSEFHIVGTVIGVITVGVAFNGLAIVGAPTFWQYVVQASLLIAAVGLSTIGRKVLANR